VKEEGLRKASVVGELGPERMLLAVHGEVGAVPPQGFREPCLGQTTADSELSQAPQCGTHLLSVTEAATASAKDLLVLLHFNKEALVSCDVASLLSALGFHDPGILFKEPPAQ